MHKLGLMLRDNVHTCEVVLKTARETGESGVIIKKLGENWGIVFPQRRNRIPWRGNQFPPRRGKKEEMRENCFTKIPIWGICVKQVGEMKGNFVFKSFNCTVLYCTYHNCCNSQWHLNIF